MPLGKDAQEFLGSLERAELELLTWGLVDSFFAENELEQRADAFLASRTGAGDAYSSGWDLVQELLDARVLWRLPQGNRFRSRMGEAVRLFSKLRQIFPDPKNAAWRDAPGLVSDYRLLVRQRTYP